MGSGSVPDQPLPTTLVTRLTGLGMMTLRCDHSDTDIRQHIARSVGLDVPDTGKIISDADRSVAWMSPDELLIIGPMGTIPDLMATLDQDLAGTVCLLADTSSLRTLFRVTGPDIRDVLARETPTDLSPRAFAPGDFRRTRFGQVAAALWLQTSDEARLACRASESDYVETLLSTSAAGQRVGYLA